MPWPVLGLAFNGARSAGGFITRGLFSSKTLTGAYIASEVYSTFVTMESDDLSPEEKRSLLLDQASYIGDTLVVSTLLSVIPFEKIKSLPILSRLRKNVSRVDFNPKSRASRMTYVVDPKKGFTFVNSERSVVSAYLGVNGKLMVAPSLLSRIKKAGLSLSFFSGAVAFDELVLNNEKAVTAIAEYIATMLDIVEYAIDKTIGKPDEVSDAIDDGAQLSMLPLDMLLDDPNYAMRRIGIALGTSDFRSEAVVSTYRAMIIKSLGIVDAVRTELVLTGSINPLNDIDEVDAEVITSTTSAGNESEEGGDADESSSSNGGSDNGDSRLSANVSRFNAGSS